MGNSLNVNNSRDHNGSLKIVVIMCLGIFMTMLDTTIMNITIPAIQLDLGVSLESISWALNIYTLLFAVCSIPLGRLAEIYGRNKVYLIGLILFAIGSLMCGLSQDSFSLILSRALQSLGAAIVFPTSMVIGVSSVSLSRRSTALTLLGMTQGLAAALGPTIGGIITQYLTWRWVFYVNLPISLLAVGLSLSMLQLRQEPRLKASIDWWGLLLSSLTVLSVTLVLVKGGAWGWSSIEAIVCYVAFPVFLILFLWAETKAKSPMVPLQLFKNRSFNGTAFTIVVSNLFLVAVTVLLPSFLTKVEGKSELAAALLVTPISAMIFVCSPIAGVLLKRLGPATTIFSGFILMGLSYLLLSTANIEQNQLWLITACLILGAGYGTIVGPTTVMASSSFQGELLAASQSVAAVLRQIGVVLAVAVYVSALTSNLTTATKQVVTHAKAELVSLSLPQKQRQNMLNQTEESLRGGDLSATVAGKAVVSAGSGVSPSKPENISNEDRSLIDKYTEEIRSYSHQQYKEAFLQLYRWSFPFVVASAAAGLIYRKKKTKAPAALVGQPLELKDNTP